MPDTISAVLGLAGAGFSIFLAAFTILFTCLFLLSDIGNMKRALASVLAPGDEERWLAVWERVTESVSRWAIGMFVIATIAGTTQGVTAWLLGSSYAVALGVIAGLLDMIPNIGATIAGFILVPVILAEEGLTAALIMLAVVLVYQQVENNVVTPKIQGRAVNLSGFFIIVSVTLFGALLGVLGALTAVPLAATIQIFVQELTKARREQVAAAKAALEPAPICSGLISSYRNDILALCGSYAYGVGGVRPEERWRRHAAAAQELLRKLRPGTRRRERSSFCGPSSTCRRRGRASSSAPRLVGRLSRERSGRVVSVVAPAGYGKTTVLGQWAARDRRQFAWLSLDHRDNDPVVFLTYVAEALNADSTVDPAVFKGLTGPGDSLWARGLPRLVSALAARPEPLVLVLDDVHELENHDCLDALATLLLHVPRGSQLVLSGRAEARLGLPKLRADGELLELGPAALALSDAEARALLTAAGADVTKAEAEALNERAEGWAAGLYLAALSLDGGSSSVASFGGGDRFVTDYLRAEELSHVEPAQLEFLLRTSVLESDVRPALRRGARARRLGADARASWSARTCSSSPSTTSAAGSATTICSGRCSRPSSSDASPSFLRLSTGERPRGAWRTGSRRSRSSTRPQRATPISSPGSSARSRFRTTAAAV